jgi:hypothetical protein
VPASTTRVAQPAHAPGLLEAVFQGKPEVLVDVGADRVGVEVHAVQSRHERLAERRLACAWQAHDQHLLSVDRQSFSPLLSHQARKA